MLKDFKPVLNILLRFIVIYLVLLFAYQFYLNVSKAGGLDPFSRIIADQVASIQKALGFPTLLYDDIKNEQVWFYVKKNYVTRMVEGCNAISVMILFMAFVFAFYKGLKTFIYALAGIVMLYIMNLLRIVGLNIVMSDYEEYGKMFHDFIFPAVIYGTVVVLWLVWIKFFALKNENS
ncbi:exosortase family protein XrtF [Chryseobacterium carnipullorum]|uniref:Exosortase family protein XrtF n=1 Tax=Chryseobacterium carnipullorum TaxID=1124835 RepID=A0A1M7CHF6_CHRCU|nr:exosortase family protein XrtF [Chryseobacterium carnipullorum]AZA47544.1 exosortase family protein XrtF [Chryseobacterium carnipullorum]AZA66875.1 exosortase family protein XrtF [Chryseobacterium carnipullorum]SHL66606.1 exosortase family protein XrtF [Chryseobacterium carnipullorum]STD10477.1 exosortase family protein XrtF [Chryseobacterium carnipullorum]